MDYTRKALRSAAAQHLGDTSALVAAGNWDQAEHLARFAPECARKAALENRWHKILGHVLVVGTVLDAVEALEPMASCVRIPEEALDALRTWKPECRYQATGTATESSARGLHDLGGIALRDLADIHVLVTRANRQGEDGLRRQLNLLSTGKAETQPTTLVLQTFTPVHGGREGFAEEGRGAWSGACRT